MTLAVWTPCTVSVTPPSFASLAVSFRERKEQVMALTDGWGVDVAVEAAGVPQTLEMCTEPMLREGSTLGPSPPHCPV